MKCFTFFKNSTLPVLIELIENKINLITVLTPVELMELN